MKVKEELPFMQDQQEGPLPSESEREMSITIHEVDSLPEDYPRHEAVAVSVLPSCDICRHVENRMHPERALFDGRTHSGPWANMCPAHFNEHGVGLGLGRGQRLVIPGIGASIARHPAGRGR